ncbi:hypothetical protein V5E97_12510 [Singulisphaera sp. Ch08]|uniref:GAF domain-containing protein n=1 Tax=Singulisphaera sp. Ch08 TaxID=3120278 RepID=A0AAU7CNC2_9BACT
MPLLWEGRLFGVLDLASPASNRFDDVDAEGRRAIAAELLAGSDLPS